jgi:hypothetical protein
VGEDSKKVRIGEALVGLYALDEIFEQISRTSLSGEALEAELLRMVKIYNYVPDEMARAYKAAILREYEYYTKEERIPEGP